MKDHFHYAAPPCPVCGKPDAARMGESTWRPFDGMACSRACGLKAQAAVTKVRGTAEYLRAKSLKEESEYKMQRLESDAVRSAGGDPDQA
jgi:ribosomal protein L37AE/L43A